MVAVMVVDQHGQAPRIRLALAEAFRMLVPSPNGPVQRANDAKEHHAAEQE